MMVNLEVKKSNKCLKNVGKSPEFWDSIDVFEWLCSIGFSEYADLIANYHKVDGPTLLLLKESDLREKPLEIKCLGVIKRLSAAIYNLQKEWNIAHKKFINESNRVYVLLPMNQRDVNLEKPGAVELSKSNIELEDLLDCIEKDVEISATNGIIKDENNNLKLPTKEELIRKVESPDTKRKLLFKLAVAFIYCTLSLLITAFVLVLVHDRVPDMKTYPPLPDIVLDNLPLIPWAFQMCELIAVFLSIIWFTILFFHKHRVVVLRRMFSLVGTVFLLRCITTLITSLSVPGVHLECRAKNYATLSMKLWEAYRIWSRLGMTIQGVRSCGDYMFSGHTTAITLLNHFITEYTPDTWHLLHIITWVSNLFGIFFILAGHEHYSIDVFIAFYISSRMFLYYHAYAYHHYSSSDRDGRMRLWFPLGWFFEAGGQGRVKNEFDFPILNSVDFFLSNKREEHEKPSASNIQMQGRQKQNYALPVTKNIIETDEIMSNSNKRNNKRLHKRRRKKLSQF